METKATNMNEVIKAPVDLLALKGIRKLRIDFMNTNSGIYFLCMNNEIVYIGQSVNVTSRVAQHLGEKQKYFNNSFFINCPIDKLDEMEFALIARYKPKYNRRYKKDVHINDKVLMQLLKAV